MVSVLSGRMMPAEEAEREERKAGGGEVMRGC